MATSAAATLGIAALSPALKDLYENGKDKFGNILAKWENSKTVSSLVQKVAAYEHVKTIWQREKEVKLTSFYYPSKISFQTGLKKTVGSLKDLPSTRSLIIQGTVGQGKSIFLRYLCIQELKTNSSGRIPVFLELRKLDEKFDLESGVTSTLKNLGFEVSPELFDYYARSGKLVLLLDGFDELNEKIAMKAITQLEAWCIEYPSMQTIVTSRPGADIQKSSHFHILRLAPLYATDYRPFMTNIGLKGEILENLLNAVEQSPLEIKELLTTPLLLTLLVLVYQVEHNIPSELPEFFKLLFVTVFSRHDGTKPAFNRTHKSGLNERKLELLFESFCFAVKRRKLRLSLSEEEFQSAYEDAARFIQEKSTVEGFRHDIVKVACLMQEDGLFITFVHKSLLDYFSAAFVSRRTDKQVEKIYSSIRKDWRNWHSTLQFLQHIDKYRYARDFAIPELTASIDLLSPGADPESSGKEVFVNMYGKANVHFDVDEHGRLTRGIFGPYSSPKLYFYDNFGNFVDPGVDDVSFDSIEELQLASPNVIIDRHEESTDIKTPYMDVVTQQDIKKFTTKIDIVRQKLIEIKTELESEVASEDAKAELFSSFDVYDPD